jgi:nitroreductase
MGVSTTKVVIISLFLITGMVLAGLLMQPKGSLQAWDVKESDFPDNGTTEDKLGFLLNYAVLAPSIYNSQPWEFNVSEDEIRLYADEKRWLQVADADKREYYLSLGCAIENLVIAAEHFGYTCHTIYFPGEKDLVAVIKLAPRMLPAPDPGLFGAILSRRTNEGPYIDRIVSDEVLEKLPIQLTNQSIQIHFISDSEIKKGFRDIVVRTDQIQYADANYKSERGHWLGQGVMGPTGMQALIDKMFVVFLDAAPEEIRKDIELVNSTPVLGFVTTIENDSESTVLAGQAFERLWLASTALGLSIHPMSQALEVPETKAELSKLLKPLSGNVQQVFLLGYAKKEKERNVHRPLEEVRITKQK